jgi:hypothetical protein
VSGDTTPPGVVITLADIYAQLITLGAKVDGVLAAHAGMERTLSNHDAELRPLVGVAADVADHESRIRNLERGRWPLPSITILIALASLALAAVAFATR